MAPVRIRLVASTREDLVRAIEALRRSVAVGTEHALHIPDAPQRPGRKGEWLNYGYIELHDEQREQTR